MILQFFIIFRSPKCSTSLSLDIHLIFIWYSSEASFAIQKTGSAHFVGGMYAAVYMWRPLRMGFGLLSCTNQPVSWNQNLDPKNEDPWAFTETVSLKKTEDTIRIYKILRLTKLLSDTWHSAICFGKSPGGRCSRPSCRHPTGSSCWPHEKWDIWWVAKKKNVCPYWM